MPRPEHQGRDVKPEILDCLLEVMRGARVMVVLHGGGELFGELVGFDRLVVVLDSSTEVNRGQGMRVEYNVIFRSSIQRIQLWRERPIGERTEIERAIERCLKGSGKSPA